MLEESKENKSHQDPKTITEKASARVISKTRNNFTIRLFDRIAFGLGKYWLKPKLTTLSAATRTKDYFNESKQEGYDQTESIVCSVSATAAGMASEIFSGAKTTVLVTTATGSAKLGFGAGILAASGVGIIVGETTRVVCHGAFSTVTELLDTFEKNAISLQEKINANYQLQKLQFDESAQYAAADYIADRFFNLKPELENEHYSRIATMNGPIREFQDVVDDTRKKNGRTCSAIGGRANRCSNQRD